jgi:hypothetical protein
MATIKMSGHQQVASPALAHFQRKSRAGAILSLCLIAGSVIPMIESAQTML